MVHFTPHRVYVHEYAILFSAITNNYKLMKSYKICHAFLVCYEIPEGILLVDILNISTTFYSIVLWSNLKIKSATNFSDILHVRPQKSPVHCKISRRMQQHSEEDAWCQSCSEQWLSGWSSCCIGSKLESEGSGQCTLHCWGMLSKWYIYRLYYILVKPLQRSTHARTPS